MGAADRVPLELLVAGFEGARKRFTEARLTNDPERTFLPLFEALSWAASLDERLKEDRGHWAEEVHLRGVRYARHSVHHKWTDALELTEGLSFPVTFPTVFHEWRWRREIIEPQNTQDEPAYAEHLAGQPARHTLSAISAFLARQ